MKLFCRPKPSPRSGSTDDEKKSPTRVGVKNAALQSKLFGSGAIPLPGVLPGVRLRKSEEEDKPEVRKRDGFITKLSGDIQYAEPDTTRLIKCVCIEKCIPLTP